VKTDAMPQIIRCPDPACGRKLRVPDDLMGKKVRCPGCGVMFQAVAAGEDPVEDPIEVEAPAGKGRAAARDDRFADAPLSGRRPAPREEDDYDRPRRRRRDDEEEDYRRGPRSRYEDDYEDEGPSVRARKAGWNKVRIGIHLVMIGTWVALAGIFLGGMGLLLGVVLLGGAAFTAGNSGGDIAQGGAGLVLMVVGLAAYALCNFAEVVLRLVGYGLCMAVPPKRDTGLKPLAITAFALAAAHALFSLVGGFVSGFANGLSSSFGQRSGGMPGGMLSGANSLLVWALAIASFVVFIIFLRSVTLAVRARHLSNGPITVLIVFACFYVLGGFIGGILVFAAFGSAFLALSSKTADGAATTMGAMAVIAIIVLALLGLVYMGLQVWFVMVLQKIRDAVDAYRRKL
jgi:hypothetical protein